VYLSGVKGTVLETYAHVSKASDAKNDDGSPNYYVTKIYNLSKYIYVPNSDTEASNWGTSAVGTTFDSISTTKSDNLTGGTYVTPTAW
jgi:hypothetical protein